ncbi:MAG: TRAP transporter substrate-binding protein DctP [Deltaproteobacteria bacterium]|nr:TRAP transporter substrate-binding protein DctP [Deltaproteobacteria bacterium]
MRRERILKPIGLSLFFLVLVIICLTFVESLAIAQQKGYNFRMQRYEGIETDAVFNQFSKDIEAMSDGKIKITQFRGGELVPNDQLLDAVGKGTLEMAMGYGGYWPGMIDVGKIESGLPGAWSNLNEAMDIYYGRGFINLAREAYAEKGVYFLGPRWGGPYELVTKKPVKSLNDLRKMKIRASATMATILKKLGVPTVFLSAEELYTGLASGTIDGLIYGGIFDYYQMKLHEVAKYYTKLNMLFPGYVDDILINMKVWKSLSPDLQRILEVGTLGSLAHNTTIYLTKNVMDVGAKQIFTVATLPPEDSAAIAEAAQVVWKEEAAKSPRNAKAIQMLRELSQSVGRLK